LHSNTLLAILAQTVPLHADVAFLVLDVEGLAVGVRQLALALRIQVATLNTGRALQSAEFRTERILLLSGQVEVASLSIVDAPAVSSQPVVLVASQTVASLVAALAQEVSHLANIASV
jgi:hypothetical protein